MLIAIDFEISDVSTFHEVNNRLLSKKSISLMLLNNHLNLTLQSTQFFLSLLYTLPMQWSHSDVTDKK